MSITVPVVQPMEATAGLLVTGAAAVGSEAEAVFSRIRQRASGQPPPAWRNWATAGAESG